MLTYFGNIAIIIVYSDLEAVNVKKYFAYVPMWLCLLVNILVGIVLSVLFLFAVICIFGLFNSPTAGDRAIGIGIFAGMAVLVWFANFILYKVCKSKRSERAVTAKASAIRWVIVAAVLIVLTLSFFILPDLWLVFNGFWF